MNAVKAFHSDGRLYTLNDNGDALFQGDFVSDDQMRNRGNDAIINRWVARSNGAEQIGLVAPKTSDALVFRLHQVPVGLEASPIRPLPSDVASGDTQSFVRPGVNSALASAAFLIRSVAADELDIDPEEFDICHIRLGSLGHDLTGRERFTGEFILADHLPNGSGFTRWLNENLGRVLDRVIAAADAAAAGETLTNGAHGEFLVNLFGRNHMDDCKWSCYSCLRNFRNMRYHPLLDWRLGTSMVRMMRDGGEQAGLDGNWQKAELSSWLASARDEAARFVQNFRSTAPARFELVNDAPSPLIHFGDWDVVVRHPLWDTVSPQGFFARSIAQAATQGQGLSSVLSVDSFDLSRRPSWVFQKLQGEEGVFRL